MKQQITNVQVVFTSVAWAIFGQNPQKPIGFAYSGIELVKACNDGGFKITNKESLVPALRNMLVH